MAFGQLKIRAIVWSCYFAFSYGVLAFIAHADPFCVVPRSSPWFIVAARLALYCTFVTLAAGLVGNFLDQWTGSTFFGRLCALTLSFVGLESIVFWIHARSGVFRLENTFADVSCLFTEGSGLGFLYLIGPVLTVAALLGEIACERLRRTLTAFPS